MGRKWLDNYENKDFLSQSFIKIPSAQKGREIPTSVKIKNKKGKEIILQTDSPEYRSLYENNYIEGFYDDNGTYNVTKLEAQKNIPEVSLKAKKPDWLKYKQEFLKNHPKEKFIQDYLDAFPWAGQSLNNYPKRLDEEYETQLNDYIGEQIVKNKPQGNKSREDWLNSMTEQEQRFVQRNPKYGTTLWQDTVEGVKALFNLGNDLQISRIKNSDNYTNLEKKDLIQQHEENPILSNIGDVAQSLSFLTVPSKMVQSTLRPEYSFSDAVQGTKNKAGVLEEFGTDPLNLVGIGAWNKLSKASKFSKLSEVYDVVGHLPKEQQISEMVNHSLIDNLKNFFKKDVSVEIPEVANKYYTEHIISDDVIPNGYKKFTDLNYNEISQIPKNHYNDLGKTIKSLSKDNKSIGKSPNNIFYNPSEGFKAKNIADSVENIKLNDKDIIQYIDELTFNTFPTKNKPLNHIDDLGNDTMLNLNDRRFHNQSIIKDDYFDGTEYSKYAHSPIDIIKDNDRMFNKTKTFIDNEIDILKNTDVIHGEGMADKWKKVTTYTGNDNPTINDKLNVKNHMISQLENSIENNANKFIRDSLLQEINASDDIGLKSAFVNGKLDIIRKITPPTANASFYKGSPYMFLSRTAEGMKTIAHEYGHNIQFIMGKGKQTQLDKDIIKELTGEGSIHFNNNVGNTYEIPYILKDRGLEPSAYFSEVKHDMMNKGFIKNRFDDIKPEVFDNYLKTENKPKLTEYMRKESLFNLLNKYYSTIPIAGGIGYEALNSEDETPKYQNGGVTDREIQVLKNTAKDNVNQSKQFELEYLNSPKFKERAIKAGYDYDTLKKQLYKNISTQKTNFYNDNGKTNGAFFNPSDNSLNFGISKNEDFEDGLINVNGDTVAHEIGHQFSSGKNLDMTKQNDLLEKSNFLLPKDFIGKVKRGYEIATNPNYYQEDGHETFNSETIADIHSARKELFDKTGIDLRYSNMTDEAFDIMLKDAFKRKENSFERIFSKIGKDKNKEILNDYFFKSTDPNEIDQIYKKYNTDEKIQKLKKDAEKAMRDNKDVIMNLMNRVVDNNDNNQDLFYAQEGGSLNNIRNILTNIYNKYE